MTPWSILLIFNNVTFLSQVRLYLPQHCLILNFYLVTSEPQLLYLMVAAQPPESAITSVQQLMNIVTDHCTVICLIESGEKAIR